MITDCWSTLYAHERVVVLGAAGFIGTWVSRYLSAARADLHLVVRDQPQAEQQFARLGIEGSLWSADLSSHWQVQDILLKLQPSIVFNLAGYGVDRSERDETTAQQINVRLVEAIAQAWLRIPNRHWQGMSFIHVGSALEYGEIGGDLAEASDPNPTTLYGRTKLEGTDAVKRFGQLHGVKGVTARLFTVYGPGEHPGRLLPTLIEAKMTDGPILLTAGTQKRDFVYVGDVAEGLLRLGIASLPPGETINLATGQLTTVRQFTEIAAETLAIPHERLIFGAVPTRAEEMNHDPINIQKMIQRIDWKPATSIVEGILHTIQETI